MRPAGVHHWKELLAGNGLIVCLSTVKSNSALAVSLEEHAVLALSMKHSVGSASPIVGMTAYKPLSKDKIHCLVLHDDGSLQIYSHAPVGVDAGVIAASEKVKKLGSGILTKAYAGTNPEFPLNFCERTICITPDVKLGGDAIRNGDSEEAKTELENSSANHYKKQYLSVIRNLLLDGPWKWLVTEFDSYYGVSEIYTKLRYVLYVMDVTTPTAHCLNLVYTLLAPIIMKGNSKTSLSH